MGGRPADGAGWTEPPQGRPLAVLLTDALHVNRAAVRLLIEAEPDLRVTADVPAADEALQLLRGKQAPGVLLCCLNLPGPHDAFWLIRAVRRRVPRLRILACGAGSEASTVSSALFMGADGFVDKRVAPDAFLEAIRRVARGEIVLEGVSVAEAGRIASGLDAWAHRTVVLTERELDVLSVAAEGLTARQIATRLGLAGSTVTTHLARIYRKLGVGSRVAALAQAQRVGLLHLATVE